MSAALVLGGGGITGIAWEIGVLRGLRAGSPRLRSLIEAPDLVVGTSAGSVVGVHVAAGTDLDALFAAQLAPAPRELSSAVDVSGLSEAFGRRIAGVDDPVEARRRIGQLAREAGQDLAVERRAAIAARLPGPDWPSRPLTVTAVDVDSGEIVAFDAASGVPLADAVGASCAVPGIWPVVTVGERTFMDGGAASMTHATVATGHDLVVVLAALPSQAVPGIRSVEDEAEELRASGAEVVVIGPDADYIEGPGAAPLDPAGRAASAEAGERYGAAFAAHLG